MKKTAIFLGGGASGAEGAPVQSLLFKKYFKELRAQKDYSDRKRVSELRAYFKHMFYIDVLKDDLDTITFPTFEEAIGLLDLAVRKRQSFKDFDLENLAQNSNRIGYIRQYLVLLMAEVLEDTTSTAKGLHNILVNDLLTQNCLSDTIFISTNYDTLIDSALASVPDVIVDYGVSFVRGLMPSDIPLARQKPVVELYKVHGSLNWSYCPACSSLDLIKQQDILSFLTEPSRALCSVCRSVKNPVIVPPTFFKDMSNSFLHMVWHKTEERLKEVSHLVFCGYSFPDADMHIKYLIKRIQTNRANKLRITIINNYPGKKPEKITEEKERYMRFLGTNIRFTDNSFEDFCRQPESFLQ